MDFDFDDVPRWWFGGNALMTHIVNGLDFVFPAGERFFIRSVRHYESRLEDADLRARVRAFYGQEAQHQRAHRAVFRRLESQGYDIAAFLAWYERVAYGLIEPRFPPEIRLATTAALEHFTATLGALALERDLLANADPAMRALHLWHAAEEIEHKSVAYDVLMAVDARYRTRLAGFAVAVPVLAMFWTTGTAHLIRQDPDATPAKLLRDLRGLPAGLPGLLLRGLRFLESDFHPERIDDRGLAEAYLEDIGRAAA